MTRASEKPRKRRLSVYLLKEGANWREALHEQDYLKEYPLSGGGGLRGQLYVRPMQPHPPWWLEFLQSAVEDRITQQNVGTMSAALFLELDDRTVVFTFGYGHHLVVHHQIEPDFGLKAALNAIDPARLRSMDLRTYEEVALLTRRQVSQGSSTSAFLVDPIRDVLTKVVGSPRSDDLGARITGRDSLSLTIPVSVDELADVARRLIELHGADTYREAFAWIDQVQSVGDPVDVARLDDLLLEALADPDAGHDVLYLAPPEILEWEEIEFFRYSSQGKKDPREFQELELPDYLSTFEGRKKPLSLDALRGDRVQVKRGGLVEPVNLTSVYRCLVFETTLEERRYVLVAGDWWRIDPNFVEEVEGVLDGVSVSDLSLPVHEEGEKEEDYLTRAVTAIPGSILMDQQMVWYGGGRSQIEFCDILVEDGTIIHAKKRGKSSILSHLWSQGTVSAEAFTSDGDFRTKVREKLPKDKSNLISEGRPDSDAYQVVYLIIGAHSDAPWKSLPFFSKVALMQATRHLRLIGFPVSLAGTSQTRFDPRIPSRAQL